MQTVCILTYERTGSGWLCESFNADQSISVHELYGDDPTLFFLNTYRIYQEIYKIEPELLSTLYNIYQADNFFISVDTSNKIKDKILSKNIYNSNLLLTIQDICKKFKYNLIYKMFPQHFKKDITMDFILGCSDIVIINYRENVLETYISLELAKKTGVWYSQQQRTTESEKLIWQENAYLDYYNKIKQDLEVYSSGINSHNNTIIISYEEIHQNSNLLNNYNKIEYIKNKINNININYNVNNNFYKQNTINFIEQSQNIFSNYMSFKKSFEYIPIKINI